MKLKVFLALLGFFLAALLLVGFYNPLLSLTVSASPASFTRAGEVIKYTYVINNIGDQHLEGIVLYDEALTVACPKETLDPGGSMTCTRDYTITAADVTAGKHVITANVSGSYSYTTGSDGCCGTTTEQTEASASISVPFESRPALSLTKTGDLASFDHVGQKISYTYVVTNTGNVTLTSPISIRDDLTYGAVCPNLPAAGLAPGESLTCTSTYDVTQGDLNSGTVTNTATAHSGDVVSDPVTLAIPVDAKPVLGLTKTANPAYYLYPGEKILFTLTITNNGNVPFTGSPTIIDSMLKNWQCSDTGLRLFSPGQTITCTATLVISDTASGSTFLNRATVQMKYGSLIVYSNAASVTIRALPTPIPPPVRVMNCTLMDKTTCENHSDMCTWLDDGICIQNP